MRSRGSWRRCQPHDQFGIARIGREQAKRILLQDRIGPEERSELRLIARILRISGDEGGEIGDAVRHHSRKHGDFAQSFRRVAVFEILRGEKISSRNRSAVTHFCSQERPLGGPAIARDLRLNSADEERLGTQRCGLRRCPDEFERCWRHRGFLPRRQSDLGETKP